MKTGKRMSRRQSRAGFLRSEKAGINFGAVRLSLKQRQLWKNIRRRYLDGLRSLA